FFQAEDGIRVFHVTGVQTCALPISLRLSAVALGIGLMMAAGTARAQDDDEDDKTFEEKIIDNLMRGIGGTNMETPTIDYRERSRSEERRVGNGGRNRAEEAQ